jgi:hypothetical protein
MSLDATTQALAQQFQDFSLKAVEYKNKIDEAKTALKKKYYEDKLAKINKKVYNILAQMNMATAVKKASKKEPKWVMADSPGKTNLEHVTSGYMQVGDEVKTDEQV